MLKLGLTTSGAISLGAYEGGALAALLLGLEDLREHVVIDCIAGASAGAITGLLAARCLALGADPVEAMRSAWVDTPDLKHLVTHDEDAPLSAEYLADAATRVLATPVTGRPRPQQHEVRVTMAMCSLAGLGYQIRVEEGDPPVDAVTYLDWSNASFGPASTLDDFELAAARALTSGANPYGFPPSLVEHTPAEIAALRAAGVHNTGLVARSWYTDGGTLDNEPFGRLLDLLDDDPDAGDERIVLLVHPIPTVLPKASMWTNAAVQPRWARTGLRAAALHGDQSIFDDLRALSKVNTRLGWVEDVAAAIDGAIAELGLDATATAAVNARLDALIDHLDDDHATINRTIHRQPPARSARPANDRLALLRAAIRRAAGLDGKRPVSVQIVSPSMDPSGAPAADLLAGEKLGHFFGFLSVRFRKSDFALGYRHMQIWMATNLRTALAGSTAALADLDVALAHVRAGYDELGWDDQRFGDAGWDTLTIGDKFRLAEVAAHTAHISERDIRHWDDGIPVPGV